MQLFRVRSFLPQYDVADIFNSKLVGMLNIDDIILCRINYIGLEQSCFIFSRFGLGFMYQADLPKLLLL